MADTKTSDESAASALSGPELIRGVQSAANVKITATQVKTFTSASPSLTTPALGVATGTSLAIGGATLGSNALAITGHVLLEGVTSTGATGTGKFVFDGTPTLVTPVLGVATGTSIALGGATLGSNALAVTGHVLVEGVASTGATGTGKFVFDGTPTLVTPVLGAATGTSITVTGALSSGTQQSVQGSLVLNNTAAGAFATTIKSSNSATAAVTYTLPTAVGASGTVLTDAAGNGVLSWAAGGGGGGITVNTTTVSGGAAGDLLYTDGSVVQAALLRYSAATLNLGAADVSSGAVAQTIAVQSNSGGSTTGPDFTIKGSKGTTAGGKIIFQTAHTTTHASVFTIDKIGDITLSPDAGGTYLQTITSDAGNLLWKLAGANSLYFNGGNHLGLSASMPIGWSSTTDAYAAADTILGRAGAATLQQGAGDAASPVAQTLQAQSVVAGNANTAGVDWTFVASKSNGSGAGGKIIFKSSLASAGSGSQNTAAASITITNSTATGIAFNGYGAGAMSTDASGNITSTSDENAKFIQGNFDSGLTEIMQIKPIRYKWKPSSGMETEHEYAGFGARNVRSAIPLATGQNPDGSLTLQDRALLAACINAIQELARRI